MQLSRFLPALAVAALALLPASIRAADTEAQIKAREALRSKLDHLDAQPVVTNAAPAAPKAAKPVPTTPAPVTAPATPEPQPQPGVAATAASEPAPTQTPPVSAHPVQTPLPIETVPSRGLASPTPPPSAQPMSAPTKPRSSRSKKTPAPVIAAPAADPEKIAQAREQMRQKLEAMTAKDQPEGGAAAQPQVTSAAPSQPPPVTEPANPPPAPKKPVPTKPAPTVAETSPAPSHQAGNSKSETPNKSTQMQPSTQTSYKPLEGPAAPVTASQRQRLDELLSRYRADQVSPEQYHQERAKILSQP